MTTLSSTDPGRPTDWAISSLSHAVWKLPAVYSLIGVEDHAGNGAAPDGHRHRQRAHVQHAVQVQLPFPVGISVPSQYQRRLIPSAANFRFT